MNQTFLLECLEQLMLLIGKDYNLLLTRRWGLFEAISFSFFASI